MVDLSCLLLGLAQVEKRDQRDQKLITMVPQVSGKKRLGGGRQSFDISEGWVVGDEIFEGGRRVCRYAFLYICSGKGVQLYVHVGPDMHCVLRIMHDIQKVQSTYLSVT